MSKYHDNYCVKTACLVYMKIHFTASVCRFRSPDLVNRSHTLLNRSPDLLNWPHALLIRRPIYYIIVQINCRCAAALILYLQCYYALKRHKWCPTNAITKFSKSVSRFSKAWGARFSKAWDRFSKSGDRYSSVYFHGIKHAVFTHGRVREVEHRKWMYYRM